MELENIITVEHLLAYCELRPYKGSYLSYACLKVNLQLRAPIVFIGHWYMGPYGNQLCVTLERIAIADELYQIFLKLHRIATKRKTRGKNARPSTYELDGADFLACVAGEVRIRKLRALIT